MDTNAIKTAIRSIAEITVIYVDLMKNLIQNGANTDQVMILQGGLLALNHATGALERLCRILEKYEPGKAQD